VSAVTGACLVIEKSKFLAVGGFDAEHFSISFNDVDLCLRLEAHGLQTIFVPEAALVHLGSATREDDDFTTGTERFRTEFRLMRERWGPRLDADPYFPRYVRLTRSGSELRLA
jgi:GT2 family glycosyltransferase